MNIVWGYNGTIIPFMPYSAFYSSDHILIDYLRANNYLLFKKKLMASFMLKHEKSPAVKITAASSAMIFFISITPLNVL